MKKLIDIALLRYLAAFYLLVAAISIVKKAYWKTHGSMGYDNLTWFELIGYNVFLDWVVVLLFMIPISHFTKWMFDKWEWREWWKIIGVHLFFSFFIGYFIFFVTALIIYAIGDFTLEEAKSNVSLDHFMRVVELNFLVYFSMIGIINVYYYVDHVRRVELQQAQLQAQMAETKLNALTAQLHPHFIFNTMNSISSLIEVDRERSQDLIADFGDLLRDVMAYGDRAVITVREELTIVDKYIDILTTRFSDHLAITKDVQESTLDAFIPTMILQPLLENAVEHGYSAERTTLNIQITIQAEGDRLVVIIENDGAPLRAPLSELLGTGTGLKNTHDRLTTLYGQHFYFELRDLPYRAGVVVRSDFPLRHVAEA